jgi:hypothetical protein
MTDWFARPIFSVTDIQTSFRFYMDQLGLTNPWRHDEHGKLVVAKIAKRSLR